MSYTNHVLDFHEPNKWMYCLNYLLIWFTVKSASESGRKRIHSQQTFPCITATVYPVEGTLIDNLYRCFDWRTCWLINWQQHTLEVFSFKLPFTFITSRFIQFCTVIFKKLSTSYKQNTPCVSEVESVLYLHFLALFLSTPPGLIITLSLIPRTLYRLS